MTTIELLAASAVLATGCAVQGSVGFGAALIASPLLLLIDTELVPGPISVATVTLSVLMLRHDRGRTDRPGLRAAVLGQVPGVIAAGVTLAVVDDRTVAVVAASLVLLGVGLSVGGLELARTNRSLTAVGALSGFMGTAAAISGPPMALAYQHATGPVLRATLCRFFLVGSALSAVALVAAGRLGLREAAAGLALVPGVLLGYAGSRLLVDRLDRGRTRAAILVISGLSALAVLIRELAW